MASAGEEIDATINMKMRLSVEATLNMPL